MWVVLKKGESQYQGKKNMSFLVSISTHSVLRMYPLCLHWVLSTDFLSAQSQHRLYSKMVIKTVHFYKSESIFTSNLIFEQIEMKKRIVQKCGVLENQKENINFYVAVARHSCHTIV